MNIENTLNIEHDLKGQRFVTTVDGHRAFLEYRLRDEVMEITHTEVPADIGGRGVAGELMRSALAAAAAASWAVTPVCSYAAAYLARHPAAAVSSTR